MVKTETLAEQISSCDCNNKQSDPFFFPIRNQRVMLITACPSVQTVSSTLLSVRFVRQMLYALLGERGVSDEGMSLLFSKKGLYWTHLHKCYNECFYKRSKDTKQYLLESLPGECASRYIASELEQLSHSLKLVVVMGRQTIRGAANYIDAFRGTKNASGNEIEIVEIDYLQNEAPEKYDELRAKVARALDRGIPEDKADPALLDTKKTRLRVGYDIELSAISEMMLQDKTAKAEDFFGDTLSSSIDRKWLDGVMVPQKIRHASLFSAWSVIENAVMSFLLDVLDPCSWKAEALHTRKWLKDTLRRDRRGFEISSDASFRELSELISNFGAIKMMDCLIRQLSYGHINAKYKIAGPTQNHWNDIKDDLDLMRTVRNIITHRTGFISTAELDRSDPPENSDRYGYNKYYLLDNKLEESTLTGIKVRTNTVYLDNQAQGQIYDLTKEVLDFVVELDNHINQ